MEGKQAIINKIIDDAEKKATEMLSVANAKAEESVKKASLWAENYKSAQEEILKKDAAEIVTRKLTVADLDVRKIRLAKKQQAISYVMEKVDEKLRKLDKKSYLKLIERLITESADEGDEILLSGDGVISSTDIKAMPVVTEKKLIVKKEKGDFLGGVKLIGKICDKDLSFDGLIKNAREEYVAKIAEKLF